MLAILNDDIDLVHEKLDPADVQQLDQAENIEVRTGPRNGYGVLYINSAKYPLNITAFRRAFAFALDKHKICENVWEGMANPQDSVVPSGNPWTIEGLLPYSYYEGNVELGRQLLDSAGFSDFDGDGWLDAPNGDPFNVVIEVAAASEIAIECGDISAEALNDLGVNAVSRWTDFYSYISRLDYHGDYDMAFSGYNLRGFDVDWLAYQFSSENADEPMMNPANFENESFDSWVDQLLYSTDSNDIYEAAIEMQRILVYESPWVIVYENLQISAFRTDRFEGHVIQPHGMVTGWWTNFKVRLKPELGGPFGGTFRTSNDKLNTLNHMVTTASYDWYVLGMLYDNLMSTDPEGNEIFWLAKDYTIEFNEDNPNVPKGHTRITFNMIDNATWTDGVPLTAEDVAFTLNYLQDAHAPVDVYEMTAAFARTPKTVVVEYQTVSLWHFRDVAYQTILPKHVFEEIGPGGLNTWNPQPPMEKMVTSGPFNISEFIEGEFIELTYNPNYFYGIDRSSTDSETTTTTTATEFTTTPGDLTMAITAGVIGAAAVLVIGGFGVIRKTSG
jgi:ABC-type transport system substrate-binding protein